MKRAFDVCITMLAMPLLLPIILILMVAVRIKLGAPVFFTQMRPGLHGRPFLMVKFRSMTDDRGSDGQLLPDSERLPRFGRFLRASSLDELPEFWNVLKGEMSLAGPRPLLMEYLPLYSPDQSRRHDVRPGITGWAQVNGRNALNWNEKFALDLWYIDNWSPLLDFKVIVMTLKKVLLRSGISAAGEATMTKFTGNADR